MREALGVLLLVASIVSSPPVRGDVESPPPPDLPATLAKGFTVTGLDGTAQPLDSVLGLGKPVLIEFWATWCVPCRKNLPHMLELSKKYGDRLTIVGLSVEDPTKDLERVRKYATDNHVGFPMYLAPGELFRFMTNRPEIAVPKLLLFTADGHLDTYTPRYSPFTSGKLKSAVGRVVTAPP